VLDRTDVVIAVRDQLHNATDELIIRYEMQANSEAFSLDTLLQFLFISKHHDILFRRIISLLAAIRLTKHCKRSYDIIEVENELIEFYEQYKSNSLYVLGTMASNLSTTQEKLALIHLEVLPKLLSESSHGQFQDAMEVMRIVCFLGGGDSVFSELILETTVIKTFSDFLRNCPFMPEKIEIIRQLDVLFANIPCRDAFFQSGLIPDLVETMRGMGEEGVPQLACLQILRPLVHTEWDMSHTDLLTLLLHSILDKSSDAKVRKAYKELFLSLAHGVGSELIIREAFLEANCK
jgi:hypothetical protein